MDKIKTFEISDMSNITDDHINEFLKNGYVVIENVFSDLEIESMRNKLHKKLLSFGINHDSIINGIEPPPQNTRIKGEASKIFYSRFKLNALLNEKMYNIFKTFIMTCIKPSEGYPQHDNYDDVLPYIDRICWRLPDHIREEGGLGLHMDRNPWNPFGSSKYRPIQGFIALTDQFGTESGGLRVVKGFHKIMNSYFEKSYDPEEAKSTGPFYRLHDKKHTNLQNELYPVDAKAGSVVLWDNRLPHATCKKLTSFDSREVIYVSYIPNIKINVDYWKQQAKNFMNNVPPPSYNDGDDEQQVDRNYDPKVCLSKYQLELLGCNLL